MSIGLGIALGWRCLVRLQLVRTLEAQLLSGEGVGEDGQDVAGVFEADGLFPFRDLFVGFRRVQRAVRDTGVGVAGDGNLTGDGITGGIGVCGGPTLGNRAVAGNFRSGPWFRCWNVASVADGERKTAKRFVKLMGLDFAS